MTSQDRPRRSNARWLWLMADVSLDRARPVFPTIEFPPVDYAQVQDAIRAAGDALSPGASYLRDVHPIIMRQLHQNLDANSRLVIEWFERFPCDDEEARPAPPYWNARFTDMFIIDPASAPKGVDPTVWYAFQSAFRGEPPSETAKKSLGEELRAAAKVSSAHSAAMAAIEKGRAEPLSPHDLAIYIRFGWNDHGTQKGLGCLELGATLVWVIALWRVFAPKLSRDGWRAIEEIAHRRDLDAWLSAQSDVSLEVDAKRYGMARDKLVSDLFPTPERPPSLEVLYND